MNSKPIVVCMCGSSRYPETHLRLMMEETLSGKIVIPLGMWGHADFPTGAKAACSDGDEASAVKHCLDELHKRKIDICDEILVVIVEGHLGSSTQREIEYALAAGKRLRFARR